MLDAQAVAEIIGRVAVCHVGFVDQGEPYVVPLNFGWEPARGSRRARFWFHSARDGRKSNLVSSEQRVCVQLEEDLGLVTHARKACGWSQRYRSVIAWGKARLARDLVEARYGLDLIMRKHSDRGGWTYGPQALERTLVWCVEVEHITAKQHTAKE